MTDKINESFERYRVPISIAVLALALAISVYTTSPAATLEFSYPASNEQHIDGFIVYENQDSAAVELWRTTAKSQRLFEDIDLGTFADDCRGLFMAPFKASKVGPYSDIYEWCPQQEPPDTYYIPADKVQGFVVRP